MAGTRTPTEPGNGGTTRVRRTRATDARDERRRASRSLWAACEAMDVPVNHHRGKDSKSSAKALVPVRNLIGTRLTCGDARSGLWTCGQRPTRRPWRPEIRERPGRQIRESTAREATG